MDVVFRGFIQVRISFIIPVIPNILRCDVYALQSVEITTRIYLYGCNQVSEFTQDLCRCYTKCGIIWFEE